MKNAWQTIARTGLALLLAAGAASASAQASASAGGRGRQLAAELQKRFAAADVNGDGKLTREEAKNGMPFVYKHFDEIDTSKSGAISLADIAVFARARRVAKQAGS